MGAAEGPQAVEVAVPVREERGLVQTGLRGEKRTGGGAMTGPCRGSVRGVTRRSSHGGKEHWETTAWGCR